MKIMRLLSIAMAASVSLAAMGQEADPTTAACPACPACPMPGQGMGRGMGRGMNVMEWHQKALEKFKAQNAELDKLVQAMNSAKGEKKVEAMAAVINKAMEQRKTWQADMEARQQKMMEWMKKCPMQSGSAAAPAVSPAP